MKEIWKDVVGYEGYYQVSNLGRVKGLDRFTTPSHGSKSYKIEGKIIKQIPCGRNKEYRQLGLCKKWN